MIPTPPAPTPSFLILIDRDGELGWLGQFDAMPEAGAAMRQWLVLPDRCEEEAALIRPLLAWGRRQPQIAPVLADP